MSNEELEDWLSECRYESSGTFTLDSSNITRRLATLLGAHPSLPWLKLVQWLNLYPTCRVEIEFAPEQVTLWARDCALRQEEVSFVRDFPARHPLDNPLEMAFWLLLSTSGRLEVGCGSEIWVIQDGKKRSEAWSGEGFYCKWVRRAGRQRYTGADAQEFRKRTRLHPGRIRSGEWVTGTLDLPEAQLSNRIRIITVLASPEEGGFAVLPPVFYDPREVKLDQATLLGQRTFRRLGGIASYRLVGGTDPAVLLRHPLGDRLRADGLAELRVLPLGFESATGPSGLESFTQISLGGYERFLLPARAVALTWQKRFEVRPVRTQMQLFYTGTVGGTELVPVRDGVCLSGLRVSRLGKWARALVHCPAHLKTDLSGLTLLSDEALREWLREMERAVAGQAPV